MGDKAIEMSKVIMGLFDRLCKGKSFAVKGTLEILFDAHNKIETFTMPLMSREDAVLVKRTFGEFLVEFANIMQSQLDAEKGEAEEIG